MNREIIIRLAQEAHGPITDRWWDMDVAALERFAALVAAHEREECAKVCEDEGKRIDASWMSCANAIRSKT